MLRTRMRWKWNNEKALGEFGSRFFFSFSRMQETALYNMRKAFEFIMSLDFGLYHCIKVDAFNNSEPKIESTSIELSNNSPFHLITFFY